MKCQRLNALVVEWFAAIMRNQPIPPDAGALGGQSLPSTPGATWNARIQPAVPLWKPQSSRAPAPWL